MPSWRSCDLIRLPPAATDLFDSKNKTLEHDPEKWIPVSRLREAPARLLILA
jgi:hypothetical protein